MSAWEIPWLAGAIVVALVLAGVFLYYGVIGPFAGIRDALSRLARKDYRPLIQPRPPLFFRQASRDIRTITDMLQQLDRQIADEGFSLRAILSSMVEGVLITDRAHRVRLVNEALAELFELTSSPVNRSVIEVFRNHELQKALEKAMESRRPQRIELTVETATPDGYHVKHFDVHMAGLNPKSNARPMAALVVFHDVTKVKSLEAMRREFLANVSHEFRTPLAIINGYIETLLDGALDDRQMAVKSLRTMQRNGRRLNLLIEDLLTVSRIEERAESLEFRYGDLHEVLLRVIESLEPTIRERGAVVEVAWPPSEREIEFDARRIDQVFSNLLENALRYGDPGSVILRVTAGVSDGWIRIAFKDNGPGIPYDDQPHIFDRFYRVHKDRSRDAGGTGLGLSIVKSVVHAHSGQVSVESTPGLGATFVVLLPVSQPAPSGEFAGE